MYGNYPNLWSFMGSTWHDPDHIMAAWQITHKFDDWDETGKKKKAGLLISHKEWLMAIINGNN